MEENNNIVHQVKKFIRGMKGEKDMDKFRIPFDDLKEICENREELEQIQTIDELKDFFSLKSSKGLWLKDIMIAVGLDENDIPGEKQERIAWIVENVIVEGIAGQEQAEESIETEKDVEPVLDEAEENTCLELSFDQLSTFLSNLDNACIQDISGKLDVTQANIYETMPVEYQDGFCVQYRQGYSEKIVARIKRTENELVAFGSLQRDGNKYHVILNKDNIDYAQFGSNNKYRLVLFGTDIESMIMTGALDKCAAIEYRGTIDTIECTVNYKPMQETGNTLCIDFGTSNTAAGSYGLLEKEENEIELVSFTDVTTADMKGVKLYPTMVYVDDCSDAEHIKYQFGYSAKKKVIERQYDTEASVFFEIKRWIGSLDDEEELRDEEGNTATVARREIVKAYILHIIDLCQQYFKVKFKKLHLSAPVKLKGKFHCEMSKILQAEGFELLASESSVDEGIAIIYNSISKLMESQNITADQKTSIMILDCGGGTTDLASCEVSSTDLNTGKRLDITTKFMNGNSNFGGNNITFRILQLLKIKLAAKFAPEIMGEYDLKEIIPYEESEILCQVEENYKNGERYNSDMQNEIYADFVNAYTKAEQIIPTVYVDNKEFQFTGELKKIKRNYFYMWQLAEQVKIKFYEEELVQVDFRRSEDKTLVIATKENYYLYKNEHGELIKVDNPGDQIEITINEIRRVLCGDIYSLLNELLSQFDVANYRYYRLAGQSCKITLFMELLKEFIPGRQLRTNAAAKKNKAAEDATGSIKLKLDCIRGSISYIRDKECGKIKPIINTDKPKLIYDVYVNRVDKEEQVLSRNNPEQIGFARFSNKATQAEFVVKNAASAIERKITVEFDKVKKVELDTIFEDVQKRSILTKEVIADLKNRIIIENPRESDQSEEELLAFAIPSKEGYGMNIYLVVKRMKGDNQEYLWSAPIYENYENESTKSFFDGRR